MFFLDEPTSGLDPVTSAEVDARLRHLADHRRRRRSRRRSRVRLPVGPDPEPVGRYHGRSARFVVTRRDCEVNAAGNHTRYLFVSRSPW
jgi:hypothetical protein